MGSSREYKEKGGQEDKAAAGNTKRGVEQEEKAAAGNIKRREEQEDREAAGNT